MFGRNGIDIAAIGDVRYIKTLSGQPLVQESGTASILTKRCLSAPGFDGAWTSSRKQASEKLEMNVFVLST